MSLDGDIYFQLLKDWVVKTVSNVILLVLSDNNYKCQNKIKHLCHEPNGSLLWNLVIFSLLALSNKEKISELKCHYDLLYIQLCVVLVVTEALAATAVPDQSEVTGDFISGGEYKNQVDLFQESIFSAKLIMGIFLFGCNAYGFETNTSQWKFGNLPQNSLHLTCSHRYVM